MKYKAIIFDFNGVLLWDHDWQEEAWNQTAYKLRKTSLSPQEMNTQVHGRNNRHTLQYLTGKQLEDAQVHELTEFKEGIYRSIALSKGEAFKLSPGSEQVFDMLVKNNIPHTIATASEIKNLNFFFEHLHLDKWFERSLVVYNDGHLPSKPAPDVYIKAAAILKLEPRECIVIEDAISGIHAASAAWIGKVIGLGFPEKFHQLSLEGKVQHVISDLTQFSIKDFV